MIKIQPVHKKVARSCSAMFRALMGRRVGSREHLQSRGSAQPHLLEPKTQMRSLFSTITQIPQDVLRNFFHTRGFSLHCSIILAMANRPKKRNKILELLPAASPDPASIYCNLSTAKLSDQPAYEAVSYAWGEPVYSERIYLPTGHLAITSNLAAALRQLRHKDRSRKLWVDAVCINQVGVGEEDLSCSYLSCEFLPRQYALS